MSNRLSIEEINALTDEERARRYWERGEEQITVEMLLSAGSMNRLMDRMEEGRRAGVNAKIDALISLLFEIAHEHCCCRWALKIRL